MSSRPTEVWRAAQRGFSMIEVMVTLLIVALGLLGVSKLQAASVSNTQIARVRAMLSLQAGSLAAAMHANPAFWASGQAPASFTVQGATVIDGSGTLSGKALPGACLGTAAVACTPVEIATLDVSRWATHLNAQMPSYAGTVTCTSTAPVGCQISLTWREKDVAINTATAQAVQPGARAFTLFVTP